MLMWRKSVTYRICVCIFFGILKFNLCQSTAVPVPLSILITVLMHIYSIIGDNIQITVWFMPISGTPLSKSELSPSPQLAFSVSVCELYSASPESLLNAVMHGAPDASLSQWENEKMADWGMRGARGLCPWVMGAWGSHGMIDIQRVRLAQTS